VTAGEDDKRRRSPTKASVFPGARGCSVNDGGVGAGDGAAEGNGAPVALVSPGTSGRALAPPIEAVLEAAAAGVGAAGAPGVFDTAAGDALATAPDEDAGVAAGSVVCAAGAAEAPMPGSIGDGDPGSSFATDGDGSGLTGRCSM